jgi:hypothetical protein
MKTSQNIFCNDHEPFRISLLFQTEVINDLNLKNRSNNFVVGIICIILGDMNNSWMEIEHCTQAFFYDIRDSKLVKRYSAFHLTLGMKSSHCNKANISVVKWKHSTKNNVL